MGGTENRAEIEKLLAGIDAGDISVMDDEFRDGKIVRETGYWADQFQPPEWRAAWVRTQRPIGR